MSLTFKKLVNITREKRLKRNIGGIICLIISTILIIFALIALFTAITILTGGVGTLAGIPAIIMALKVLLTGAVVKGALIGSLFPLLGLSITVFGGTNIALLSRHQIIKNNDLSKKEAEVEYKKQFQNVNTYSYCLKDRNTKYLLKYFEDQLSKIPGSIKNHDSSISYYTMDDDDFYPIEKDNIKYSIQFIKKTNKIKIYTNKEHELDYDNIIKKMQKKYDTYLDYNIETKNDNLIWLFLNENKNFNNQLTNYNMIWSNKLLDYIKIPKNSKIKIDIDIEIKKKIYKIPLIILPSNKIKLKLPNNVRISDLKSAIHTKKYCNTIFKVDARNSKIDELKYKSAIKYISKITPIGPDGTFSFHKGNDRYWGQKNNTQIIINTTSKTNDILKNITKIYNVEKKKIDNLNSLNLIERNYAIRCNDCKETLANKKCLCDKHIFEEDTVKTREYIDKLHIRYLSASISEQNKLRQQYNNILKKNIYMQKIHAQELVNEKRFIPGHFKYSKIFATNILSKYGKIYPSLNLEFKKYGTLNNKDIVNKILLKFISIVNNPPEKDIQKNINEFIFPEAPSTIPNSRRPRRNINMNIKNHAKMTTVI